MHLARGECEQVAGESHSTIRSRPSMPINDLQPPSVEGADLRKTRFSRRAMLAQSSAIGLTLAAGTLTGAKPARAVSPNEKLNLAVIGIRGRGQAHVSGFAKRPDCQLSYLCDVDSQYFPAAVRVVEDAGSPPPKTVADMRRIFDDKSVDAVVNATPDHWHALATIWACQAGKDVYVEKPVSANCWEGRKMVEAARKYRRIVQSGMQSRSAPYVAKAKEYVESGKLGRIELVRVYNQKPENNVLPANTPQPSTLDWDLWNGCAPKQPFNPTMYSVWRCFWRYGGGEVANDGVHQLDLARFVLNLGLPKSIYTVGRPFATPGMAETPDTVITTFDFGTATVVYEQTLYAPYMIKGDAVNRDGDVFPWWQHNGERIEIFGTEGQMILGRLGSGWQVFGRQYQRRPVILDEMHGSYPDPWHHDNFVRSVRERSTPVADIEEGHKSALLCHAANISYRVGNELLKLDPVAERFTNSDAANQLLRYEYRSPYVISETL